MTDGGKSREGSRNTAVIQPSAPVRGRPQVFTVTKGEPARPPGCLPNPNSPRLSTPSLRPSALHHFLQIITGLLRVEAPQKSRLVNLSAPLFIYLFFAFGSDGPLKIFLLPP